ncbi:MAG: transposase [Geminicoccaceae bacterium]
MKRQGTACHFWLSLPNILGLDLRTDDLKMHHAKKVKAWVHRHRHAIEPFFLPAYAPEHKSRPRPQP